MKRYFVCTDYWYDMADHPKGDWVRYEDHEAELAAARKEIAELKKRLEIYEDD